jgi:sulfatase maturation enzyme AslB (radical SAM superfamily)
VPFTNSAQTNLTTLSDATLEFMTTGFFGNIGVSFDVFGDQRTDAGGRSTEETVLRNMKRLRESGLSYGCIVVLSQKTAP